MKINKIFYIANIRMPTEKAHGIQVMKMCESFALAGREVKLLVPWRTNKNKEDPFEYYKVRKIFSIHKLFSLDLVFLGKIGFWIQSFTFTLSCLLLTLFLSHEDVVYYSRDELAIFFLSLMKRKVVWEVHRGDMNLVIKKILARKVPIVTITNGLKNFLLSNGARGDIMVAPDAVDIRQFQINRNKNEIRSELGIEVEKKIVLYAGHLYEWKGVYTLAEASRKLGNNVEVIFVGGTDQDIKNFREKFSQVKNIRILGRKPHHEIPLYLKAADILVIPNSAKEDISKLYTSPMKLFEYMASGTPIVAADISSLREILTDFNACFFKADNVDSLASVVSDLLEDERRQKEISSHLARDIMNYSWGKRVQNIFHFINYV